MPTPMSIDLALVLFIAVPIGAAFALAAALSVGAALFKNKGNDQ